MYIDKTDISLEVGDITGDGELWFNRITTHELAGLQKLGCKVVSTACAYSVTHPDLRKPFYNRHMGLGVGINELGVKYDTPMSLVIPSVRKDAVATERMAIELGWKHKLSSLILANELVRRPDPKTDGYTTALIDSENTLQMGFSVFSTFFLKPDERLQEAELRFRTNVSNGPHLLACYGEQPVAVVGTIAIGDTATFYSGLVDQNHRTSKIIDNMMIELCNILFDSKVRYMYMKTRNKAVYLYSMKFYKVKHVYNERVYEKE